MCILANYMWSDLSIWPGVFCMRTVWSHWCEHHNLFLCIQSDHIWSRDHVWSWPCGRLRKCVQVQAFRKEISIILTSQLGHRLLYLLSHEVRKTTSCNYSKTMLFYGKLVTYKCVLHDESCSKLHFLPKIQWANMSVSPCRWAAGLQKLLEILYVAFPR